MSGLSTGGTQRPQKRWRYFVITGIVLSVFGSWAYYNHIQATSAEATALAANVEPAKRTQVHALGRLEPAGSILQLAPKSGNESAIVDQLMVKEGDDVEAGATLAVLDNHPRRIAALEEAKAKLEAAESRLLQTKAGAKAGEIEAQQAAVLLAESQSRFAAKDLKRALELKEKQAIAPELIDQRQWEFDRLQLEQRRASGLLASLREVRAVDVAVLEKEIVAAKAAVERAQADADASVLKAPFASRILKIHTHAGEKISDRGVLELGDVLRMQAVAEVFEADISILETGMVAEVRIDSSDERITGHIIDIGHIVARKVVLTNDPVSDTDARVVEVRIDLDPEQISSVTRLSNARVEVTIFLDSSESRSGSSQLGNPDLSPAAPATGQRATFPLSALH